MKCIAIDDEPLALKQLTDYISRVPFLSLVKSCQDAFEAMKVLADEEIDLSLIHIFGEDVAQGSEYPVHGIFQIIVDQTGADADQCRVERTVIAACYILYSLGVRSHIPKDISDGCSLTGLDYVVGTMVETSFDLV